MNLSSNCTYQEVIERLLELADLDSAERLLIETKLTHLGEVLRLAIFHVDERSHYYRQDLKAKQAVAHVQELQEFLLGK